MSSFEEIDALEITSMEGKSWDDVAHRVDTTVTQRQAVYCFILKDGTRSGWRNAEAGKHADK